MGSFSLLAKLGFDTTAFEVGAKRAQSMAMKLGGDIKGQLGAALGVASVVAFSKSVINLADEIGDLSEQMNISTDDVQKLQVVAGQSGVKFETIAKGLVNLNQARLKAVEGSGKERTAFQALGLSLDDVNNASVDNITTAQKLQVAYEASGKSAASQAAMIEIFGVKAYQAGLALNGLKGLGPINLITKDQIDKLGNANDELDEQYRILKTKTVPVLTTLLDLFNSFLNAKPIIPVTTSQIGRMMQSQTMAGAGIINDIMPEIIPFEGPMPPTAEELAREQALKNIGSEKLAQIKAGQPLGQGADSFAKIGLFGGFQSSQDRMLKELQTQANYLKYIQRASEKTADAVGQ